MLGIVERRVPERHDAVADVLVDGPLASEHHVGHRRQQSVDQGGQALRVGLVPLGDRGEAADVAEHDGHRALLAAEAQPLGMPRQLVDQLRREVLLEGAAYLPPFRLGLRVRDALRGGEHQQHHQRRLDGIEQPAVLIERQPRSGEHQQCGQATHRQADDRAERTQQHDHDQAEHQHVPQLHAVGEVRPLEEIAGQDLLDRLGVNLDAGNRGIERGGADVVQAGGAGPDEHDLTGNGGRDRSRPRARSMRGYNARDRAC